MRQSRCRSRSDIEDSLELPRGRWEKAVYAYPSEFYELGSRERPELQFGPARSAKT